jgi:hypothetical protein
MNKLVGFVNNTDLRNGHEGLTEVAKKQLGISTSDLGKGEMIAFMNSSGTKVKVFAGPDVVAYLKARPGRKIDPRVIQMIPEHFSGGKIEYDKAMTQVMKTSFPKWFEKKIVTRKPEKQTGGEARA